jgi:hypothetical protein
VLAKEQGLSQMLREKVEMGKCLKEMNYSRIEKFSERLEVFYP